MADPVMTSRKRLMGSIIIYILLHIYGEALDRLRVRLNMYLVCDVFVSIAFVAGTFGLTPSCDG